MNKRHILYLLATVLLITVSLLAACSTGTTTTETTPTTTTSQPPTTTTSQPPTTTTSQPPTTTTSQPPTTTSQPPTTTTSQPPTTTTSEPPTTTASSGSPGPISANNHVGQTNASLCNMCHTGAAPLLANPADHADYAADSCLDAGCHELP